MQKVAAGEEGAQAGLEVRIPSRSTEPTAQERFQAELAVARSMSESYKCEAERWKAIVDTMVADGGDNAQGLYDRAVEAVDACSDCGGSHKALRSGCGGRDCKLSNGVATAFSDTLSGSFGRSGGGYEDAGRPPHPTGLHSRRWPAELAPRRCCRGARGHRRSRRW